MSSGPDRDSPPARAMPNADTGQESRRPLTRTFGLRLALWYATLFVSGAIAIVFVTYFLTAASLTQRDHQIINGKLGDYAAAYLRGGARVLAATVRTRLSLSTSPVSWATIITLRTNGERGDQCSFIVPP